jgi:hypothetical protein
VRREDAERLVDDPADELGLEDVQAWSHRRTIIGSMVGARATVGRPVPSRDPAGHAILRPWSAIGSS